MINKYKIHRIVEYIKQSEFEFEINEVIQNLEEILAEYGYADIELNQDEFLQLMLELIPLAEEFEFREVAYIISQDDPLLSEVHEHEVDFRLQAIEKRLRRAASPIDVNEFLHNVALV